MKNKIKTKKAAAKRIKITSTGKLKRLHTKRRHLLEHKSSKLKRGKRIEGDIQSSDKKKIQKMLPGML